MKKEIVFFDATEARRERMRMESARAEMEIRSVHAEFNIKQDHLEESKNDLFVSPDQQPVISSAQQPKTIEISSEELDSYLINFVVEQTGYPDDMVDLDADLEGDLGIDSIKKAQLFGELNEMFHFSTADDMNGETSLDDFATLRAIRDFMLKRLNGTSSVTSIPSPQTQSVVPSEFVETESAGISPEELDVYLINFVVEQTGYPEDMVDLDADLEGDLGIDSIKKAQLLGELNEMFHFSTADDMDGGTSLDDFTSLRAIRDFMLKRLNGSTSASLPSSAQTLSVETLSSAGSNSSGVSSEELDVYLINFVVEQTGYPEDMVDLDADLEGDLGIDSIKKAQLLGELNEMFHFSTADDMDGGTSLDNFTTLRAIRDFMLKRLSGTSVASTSIESSQPDVVTVSDEKKKKEIRDFLKNFVVELTGFPSDLIDFDADLETELAVESVKKAQLFGELAENYAVFPLANHSLEEYTTLRQIFDEVVKELE
ncbi:MAG: hypothetical protein IJM54_03660 [Thermoguttaceae bacterium]|nr:hypothetical protein [Thermoguttaceae bacterium]